MLQLLVQAVQVFMRLCAWQDSNFWSEYKDKTTFFASAGEATRLPVEWVRVDPNGESLAAVEVRQVRLAWTWYHSLMNLRHYRHRGCAGEFMRRLTVHVQSDPLSTAIAATRKLQLDIFGMCFQKSISLVCDVQASSFEMGGPRSWSETWVFASEQGSSVSPHIREELFPVCFTTQ